MNMTKRIEALEKASPAAMPRRVIRIMSVDEDETTEAAVDRWCAENPDETPPAEEDMIILRSLV